MLTVRRALLGVLLVLALFGVNACGDDGPTLFKPGIGRTHTLELNVGQTLLGLGVSSVRDAELRFDDTGEVVPVEAVSVDQKPWGDSVELDRTGLTWNGVEVADLSDNYADLVLVIETRIPDEPAWHEREGIARWTLEVSYLVLDEEEKVLGQPTVKEKVRVFDHEMRFRLIAPNPE